MSIFDFVNLIDIPEESVCGVPYESVCGVPYESVCGVPEENKDEVKILWGNKFNNLFIVIDNFGLHNIVKIKKRDILNNKEVVRSHRFDYIIRTFQENGFVCHNIYIDGKEYKVLLLMPKYNIKYKAYKLLIEENQITIDDDTFLNIYSYFNSINPSIFTYAKKS